MAVYLVDGEHFNINEGIGALLKITAIGAVVSVLAYLKESPIPGAGACLQPGEAKPGDTP